DDVVTWNRGSQRVLLLKGNVLVEQGVIHARMRTGVAWVDLESQQKTGILRAEFYAEGDVRLENGADSQSGPKALLDLNTRGEFKLQAPPKKVVQEPRPDDPLYRRGLAGGGASRETTAPSGSDT